MTATPGSSPQREALDLFVQARIGGEPIGTTATSDLMLQTVTKALGAAGTLADSPELGLSGGKPVTKLIRAAGVAVYLLSDTLAGRGLKRGLGLAVLALGAALVAIALLSGAAPAWLATLGFGILLGGLAYAALSSGMLALALVLATPVIPLFVWSSMQGGAEEDSGSVRVVQIALIVMLILTALVMGTVRTPEARPTVAAGLRLIGVVVGVTAVVAGSVWLVRTVIPELPGWLLTVLVAAGVIVVLLLAAAALKHLVSVNAGVAGAADPALAERRAHAAAWAWSYGVIYVVLALLLGVVLRVIPPADRRHRERDAVTARNVRRAGRGVLPGLPAHEGRPGQAGGDAVGSLTRSGSLHLLN